MADVPQNPIPPPTPGPYPEQGQAVTVLVLGILSIVVCQLLGPFAWKLGNDELRGIAEGRRSPEGLSMAQAGRITGIIGTCLLALGVAFLLFFLVAALAGFGIFVAESTRS
jgi:TRAP-type C4-dicarboxylate transport system permease small subunit